MLLLCVYDLQDGCDTRVSLAYVPHFDKVRRYGVRETRLFIIPHTAYIIRMSI